MKGENPNYKLYAFTGDNPILYNALLSSIKNAESIDIIVSFLMESGVKLIIDELKLAVENGVEIRILTGNYLNITQPQALYLIQVNLEIM